MLYEPGMSCQLYVCVNFVHYVMLLLANKMMMMMKVTIQNVGDVFETQCRPSSSAVGLHL